MSDKDQFPYDAIGTATAPATLTAAYTGNTKTLLCKYLPHLHIDAIYTPETGQTDRYVEVLIEVSNDEGTTFYLRTVQSNSTTESKVYEDNDTGVAFILPGDKTSTGGVAYDFAFDDANVIGDQIKISARESGAANFGTLSLRVTLSD